MKTIKLPKLEQGDLLRVTLTGSKIKNYRGKPLTGTGWLLINELSVDGEVINANFKPDGTAPAGYGNVTWPEFEAHVLLRGRHGECSPFTAIMEIFKSKVSAVALT